MPSSLFEPLQLSRGAAMANRFALAPLTNQQSHDDGTLSKEEFHWLTLRAQGGFGMTMTCAAHVQAIGQGFPGQLGVWGDHQLPGLTRLAAAISEAGSMSIAQLHHAGNRSPAELIGTTPVCPSDHDKTGARALNGDEVAELVDDFVAAAVRCEQAGFDGVELHGAHGYIICQFLSASLNQRGDIYGGSLENRSRLLFEILDGIRSGCGDDFIVGVRLSPERFGMKIDEIRTVSQQLIDTGKVDFLDLSLWDCFKEPEEDEWKGRPLVEVVCDLERRNDPTGRPVPIGVAGKLHTTADIHRVLDAGADLAFLGRVAILHHDYPKQIAENSNFEPVRAPVSSQYLADQGVSPSFVSYLANQFDFVADPSQAV